MVFRTCEKNFAIFRRIIFQKSIVATIQSSSGLEYLLIEQAQNSKKKKGI